MTQQIPRTETQLLVPSSLVERLRTASSLEEIQAMVMELESIGAFDPYSVLPYDPSDPNQYYNYLRQKYRHDLLDKGITLYKASQDYNTSTGTISRWIEKGYVRVIEKSPKPGVASKVNERDVAIMVEMNRRFRDDSNKGGIIKGWRPQPLREDED